ncbi:macrophage-expressed gene 1 protein [Malaclemys terrapin pileata]|uniref:macrophage-expressed gene 1 protein n=1 Tax=Malaclemys terrapin pileata TaxID=2991368 RepID=UPI0023A90F64|nr:macrophage-expressed gene 1 protein [Malaclemys terrapin pileata]
MNTLLGALLSWSLVAWVQGAEKPPEPPVAAGFQGCKKALKLPGLEVLPGGGWDNLRNLDMGRVISLGYSLCKTTEDGSYIIPDEVFTIPRKQSNLEINSEIIETWMDYKSAVAASVNTEVSLFSSLNGKFSSDFRKMKTHQVKDQAMTTRVQVRNLVYTAKFDPGAALDKGFRQQLVAIAGHLENNQSRMADYLAEVLVLNYGTHVLTSVDAGASLVQEDQIKSTFVQDNMSARSAITAAVGASFHSIINFSVSESLSMENSFTKHYLSNRTNSRVESIGGVPFYPGITLKAWQERTTNQLVAIDRSGLPLHFFITPSSLPELPSPTVKKLSRRVELAARRYYTFNTYPGCTDTTSPNFNFHANADDGSCKAAETNFTFGGAYQECVSLWGPDKSVLCQGLEHRNPLTGAFSCPVGYTPVRLSTQEREEGYSHLECHRSCKLLVFCKRVCQDVFWLSKVQFSAFWCMAKSQVPENSGYLFGGLFSSRSVNPLTNAQSCPSGFFQLTLFDQLQLCVSTDYEMGHRYSVPFGGFFSCETGNPLAGSHQGTVNDPYLKRCPAGFSQHLALISDGCQVEYCVQSGIFTGGALPPARLPPYTRPPAMTLVDMDTVLVTNADGERSWVKDAQTQMWRLGDPTETRRAAGLGGGGGLSGKETAGVTVAVTTGLAILIALAVYGSRRYKARGYRTVEEGQSLVPDSSVYDTAAELGERCQQDPESQTG